MISSAGRRRGGPGLVRAGILLSTMLLADVGTASASDAAVAQAESSATFGFVLALECQPEAGQAALDRANDYARLTLQSAGLSPEKAAAEAAALLAKLHIQPMVGPGKAATCAAMLKKYADQLPFLWLELNLE